MNTLIEEKTNALANDSGHDFTLRIDPIERDGIYASNLFTLFVNKCPIFQTEHADKMDERLDELCTLHDC